MAYNKQTWRNNELPVIGQTPINANRLNHMEQGILDAHQLADAAQGLTPTQAAQLNNLSATTEKADSADRLSRARGVLLDDFPGTNDSDRLDAAMAFCQAQRQATVITLGPRIYEFTRQIVPYDGFALIGHERMTNAEKINVTTPTPSTYRFGGSIVRCRVGDNKGWIQPQGEELWNLTIKNIAFIGNSTTTWLGGGNTGLWCMHLNNVSFSNFRSTLGSPESKLLLTLCLIDGWFSSNNTYKCAIHIGGSDNALFLGLTNIDSSTAHAAAGGKGQYLIWLDSLAKTTIGPIYSTGEGDWGVLRVTGAANNTRNDGYGGPIWIAGAKLEGRNKDAACNGALIQIEGGQLMILYSWLGYAMKNPESNGHSPQDAGVIHQTGGALLVSAPTYDRAEGVSESIPLIYSSGGVARVRDVFTRSKGGTWAGLPRVSAAVSGDDTVTKLPE